MSSKNNDRFCMMAIVEAIEKIKLYSAEYDNADAFYSDTKSFDASMMQFVIIGEMVGRLSELFRQKYNNIPWQEVKDFRNLVAHDYLGLSAYDVWEIIQDHLYPLEQQLQTILEQQAP